MKFSIRKKTVSLIFIVAFILSGVALFCNVFIIKSMVDQHYKYHSREIAATMASVVDGDKVKIISDAVEAVYHEKKNLLDTDSEEYFQSFSYIKDMPEFDSVRKQLRLVQDKNEVDCIYIIIMIPENRNVIYVCDGAYENQCEPGTVDPLFEINFALLQDPSIGFLPYISNTPEYGWLVTAGSPVYSGDEIVGYTMVDISMKDVLLLQAKYVSFTFLILILVAMIMCHIGVFFEEKMLIQPIKALTGAASSYSIDNIRNGMNRFSSLDIKTGDELEQLLDAMKRMEKDLQDYVNNMYAARKELLNTKEEAENMNRLANVDALTGVRNKRAYDTEIERLERSIKTGDAVFGIVMVDMNYLKILNDTYGHKKGDIAIRGLCRMICNVFDHSPVFRIGGDEFVVILEKDQFKIRDELVAKLRKQIKDKQADASLEPWERISAAIGYAIYRAGNDHSVEDVFKRADDAMYENKKKMKENMK